MHFNNKPEIGLSKLSIQYFGGLLFFIVVTIQHLITTEPSRAYTEIVQNLSSLGVIFLFLCAYFSLNVNKRVLLAISLLITIYVIGYINSIASGANDSRYYANYLNIFVILTGASLLIPVIERGWFDFYAKWLIAYVSAGLIFTVIVGGFILEFPPRFIFEYAAIFHNVKTVEHSQEISRFFGLGGILCMYVVSKRNDVWLSALIFIFGLIFLVLSLIGGARGDSVFAVVVAFTCLYFRYGIRMFIPILIAYLILLISIDDVGLLVEDFLILQRLMELGVDELGYRDRLLIMSIELIAENPRCLVIGCGFSFFQLYHGVELGWHPHNFIAELIIVYGLPLSLLFAFFTSLGVFYHWRKVGGVDLFLVIFAYYFLVSLKSGSLMGHWFLMIGIAYFISLSLFGLSRSQTSIFTRSVTIA